MRRTLAADWASLAEAIYVFSGDGTYNEVINGLRADIPVGFVPGWRHQRPAPRARSPARSQPRGRPDRAGTPRRISLGRINGRMFAFNAGIGFDAELVRRVDAQGRPADGNRPGDLAFTWTVVRALVDHRLPVRVGARGRRSRPGRVRADRELLAVHLRRGLGLGFVPGASFEGGLDIVAPIEVRPRAVPRLATQALRGRPRPGRSRRARPRPDRGPLRRAAAGAGRRRRHRRLEEAEIVAVRDALTVLT